MRIIQALGSVLFFVFKAVLSVFAFLALIVWLIFDFGGVVEAGFALWALKLPRFPWSDSKGQGSEGQ